MNTEFTKMQKKQELSIKVWFPFLLDVGGGCKTEIYKEF